MLILLSFLSSESLIKIAARAQKKSVIAVIIKNKLTNLKIIREKIQSRLEKFFYKTTGRWPMVLVVVIKV